MAQICHNSKTESTCMSEPECYWYNSLNKEKEFYSEEFCHAPEGTPTDSAEWGRCHGLGVTACAAPCVLDYGTSLIPPNDYCAARFMKDYDQQSGLECVQSLDEQSCNALPNLQCKWYKGKQVAHNTDFVADQDLFTTNFCHIGTLVQKE
jgi:uncharacterized protein YodC (DUF2158 family)